MNRLSTRVDDILRLRCVVPGFGGSFATLADMRWLAWRCSEARDEDLAAGTLALVQAHDCAGDLLRKVGPMASGMTYDLAIVSAICHLPDRALREALKNAFCGCVERAAGRLVHVERRRQARAA